MKKIALGIILFVSTIGFAQDWQTDLEAAKKLATDQDKNIIIVFSGSDWCAPCIKLDKNIWQSDAFKNQSANDWILLKADFPRKKANELSKDQTANNRKLAEKYNIAVQIPIVIIACRIYDAEAYF